MLIYAPKSAYEKVGMESSSVEKHSVAVIGAVAASFAQENVALLHDPRVLQVSASEIAVNNHNLIQAKVVIFNPREIPKDKTVVLKQMMKDNQSRILAYEVFDQGKLQQRLRERLSAVVRPPVGGSPPGNGSGLKPNPEPPPPPPDPPQPNPGARSVKYPLQGIAWKLPEFIRANAYANCPVVRDEVEWLLSAAHANGFPEARRANVEQHLRKLRGKKVAGPRKPAFVATDVVELPAVAEFLSLLQQLVEKAPAAVKAIKDERAANQTAISSLKTENQRLDGELEKARQAAKLLAGLGG